jgi:D-alanyl-D-alanine carboxypeptidase (penicillin-binding protein 5/6)
VATIQFSLDGKVIDQRKLVAAKEIKQAGIFGRMIDSIRMLFA